MSDLICTPELEDNNAIFISLHVIIMVCSIDTED